MTDQERSRPEASAAASDEHAPASAAELLYEIREGVATVTINRPERRNALSWEVVTAMREAIADARSDDSVRVLVITGAGDRAFCAGADLGGMQGDSHAEVHAGRGELAALFEDLWSLGKPTVARVRGYCLAGGFGLALSCDLVVASDDSTFGTPEVNVGLWPYMITVPLCRSMPPKRALELMMTGRRIDAEEADRFGFLTRTVPAAELDSAVQDLTTNLAAASPSAMRLGRDSFYATWGMAASEALAVLHPMLTVATGLEDATEGITAFLEKREPNWTGR
jgi:enoyl-CoA hydratase/carnithine racemase